MLSERTLYGIRQVPEHADFVSIRKQYLKLSVRAHPDVTPTVIATHGLRQPSPTPP